MTVFENAEILVSYELESIRKRAQVLQGARKELRSQYPKFRPVPMAGRSDSY